jgi:hypothetical protein
LARAKNTQRANARRRYREQVRVNVLSDGADPNELDDGPEPTEPVSAPAPSGGIAGMFSRPHVREDIRALPGMFRAKRTLWLPFAILIVTAVLFGSLEVGLLPTDAATIVAILAQLVLYPTALFVPFIAGFLAPRASYLIGFLVGLVQAILVSLLNVLAATSATGSVIPPSSTTAGATSPDLAGNLIPTFLVCLLFGTVAAAFASWYRNFLRNSQQRAQANRIVREKAAREKAKDREREQRTAEREARKGSPRKAAP